MGREKEAKEYIYLVARPELNAYTVNKLSALSVLNPRNSQVKATTSVRIPTDHENPVRIRFRYTIIPAAIITSVTA